MWGIEQLAQALAFLDAVAEQEGKGAGYVSATAKAEAVAEAGAVVGYSEAIAAAAVGYLLAEKMAGVGLDPNSPFSDASLSNALAAVLGVPVASVRDREALKDAIKRAITQQISWQTGVPFEDVFSREALRRDTLRAVGRRSSEVVPGLYLRDLSDRGATIGDVEEYARLKISDLTGIRFNDLRSKQQIKEDVYAWALPILAPELLGEAGQYTPGKPPLKMDKKSVRNREAQRRFRLKWGDRSAYQGVRGG